MKTMYSIKEFADIMREKGISESDCEKVCNILKQSEVEYLQLKLTEQTLREQKPLATPVEIKHDGIVVLKYVEGYVATLYEKDEEFISIVKALGFSWDFDRRYWGLQISERTGIAKNVMAELGNHLLNSGFTVRFETQEILDAAVNGDYEPIHQRWIENVDGYFILEFEHNYELYKVIMTLPRAKYNKGNVKVPEISLDAILDLADRYDFKFAKKAQIRIKELQSSDYRVTPRPIRKKTKPEIKETFDILEDLKDE